MRAHAIQEGEDTCKERSMRTGEGVSLPTQGSIVKGQDRKGPPGRPWRAPNSRDLGAAGDASVRAQKLGAKECDIPKKAVSAQAAGRAK